MNGTILVVEDDEALAGLVLDYLAAEGFECGLCADGEEALSLVREKRWDLVILDLMLPGATGFDILKALRAVSDVPVLIVSARIGDADKIRGLGLGADDYVSKPFSPSELMARVKGHLSRYRKLTGRESSPRGLIECGPLQVDEANRLFRVRGREITLTAIETELLLLFVNNPNRLFSKEELYARIWGESTVGDQSTVTVHVRKIREKIEEDPSDPQIIQTVWGLGYRLRLG